MLFWASWSCFAELAVLFLIVHGLVYPPRWRTKRVRPWWPKVLVLWVLEATTYFLWLGPMYYLGAWLLWIGDQQHWFWDYYWVPAAATTLLVASLPAWWMLRRGTTRGYYLLHFWGAWVLVNFYVAGYIYENTRHVLGHTPEEAAQRLLLQYQEQYDIPLRLVPDRCPLPEAISDLERGKRYWIVGPQGPVTRIGVRPHRWYGWQFSYNYSVKSAEEMLQQAQQRLQSRDARSLEEARAILEAILELYPPGSPAVQQARRLLERLAAKNKNLAEPAHPAQAGR